jgi:hypothetical protein
MLEGWIMHKISIRFYNDTFHKLQETSTKKEIPFAQYVRELIEIGLRVEEISANYDDKNKKNNVNLSTDSKILWKNNLLWSLESLYLIRCLMNDLLPNMSEQYLNTAKQKAQTSIEVLLREDT